MTEPRRVYLLGRKVRHSVSPAFQNAAFRALDLPFVYEPLEFEPEAWGAVLERLRSPECAGANVTIPYKEDVAQAADAVDETVRVLGAANTVVQREGRLEAHNTDVGGFTASLLAEGFEPRGRRAVVLGAGGAARGVVLALHNEGIAGVVVVNRTLDRAERLARELNRRTGAPVKPAPWDRVARDLARADLIVNCTSIGMRYSETEGQSPLDPALLPPAGFVVDIVANPLETPLVLAARRRGCHAIGGLPMLVHQGALSFEYWTGQPAPIDIMMAAARAAMEPPPGAG